MSPQENFSTHKDTITAITKDEYLQPLGVTDEILSDGRRINEIVLRDKETLLGAGLSAEHIDLLPIKLDCYAIAASAADTAITEEGQVKIEWKEREKEGFKYKRLMHHEMGFAYRKDPEISEKLTEIAKGVGRSDMVMDLKDYATLGRSNPAPLEAAPLFKMEWLDTLENLHFELSNLLAKLESSPQGTSDANTLKRQAFTWLESSLNEIREYAEYVFHDDDDKLKDYKRDYLGK